MGRVPLEEVVDFFTLSQVAKRLKMSRKAVRNRIDAGIFKQPTKRVKENIRLFDELWVQHAEIMRLAELKLISEERRDLALGEIEARVAAVRAKNG